MKIHLFAVLLVGWCSVSDGKTLLRDGTSTPPRATLRPRLMCQELCRVQCGKAWTDFKACFDIGWGCLTGCANACHEESTVIKCREKCTDSFDQRCDALGCNRGCALGSSYEIRFDDMGEGEDSAEGEKGDADKEKKQGS